MHRWPIIKAAGIKGAVKVSLAADLVVRTPPHA
jgi:hypothetical protein